MLTVAFCGWFLPKNEPSQMESTIIIIISVPETFGQEHHPREWLFAKEWPRPALLFAYFLVGYSSSRYLFPLQGTGELTGAAYGNVGYDSGRPQHRVVHDTPVYALGDLPLQLRIYSSWFAPNESFFLTSPDRNRHTRTPIMTRPWGLNDAIRRAEDQNVRCRQLSGCESKDT